jgi:catechol 2,3-dioxygenase-like lactoylglutathione lyase family enzyme
LDDDGEDERESRIRRRTERQQAVPFFRVADMDASVRFYVDGLGFQITNRWVVDGKLRWCGLENGGAALMLQQFSREGATPGGRQRRSASSLDLLRLQGRRALYREFVSRGLPAGRPFVGNNMWVTSVLDPHGYRLEFESPTDVPEDSVYSG